MTEEKKGKSENWQSRSKFFLGEKAFVNINEMLLETLKLGHIARGSMSIGDIIRYFKAIRTTYIPLCPVLNDNDKEAFDNSIKDLIENYIDPYRNTMNIKKGVYIIEELTKLEMLLYMAMQNIDMYIAVTKPIRKKSQVSSFKQMFRGSSTPVNKNEYEDDMYE